jgi:alkylhydroperoxidase/carboxymuconolactone decarboxylase family protein YurZ
MRMASSILSKLKNLDPIYFLPILASVAILRNEKRYREILNFLKTIHYDKKEIYETLLQNYLFAGFPSVLISLKIADEYFHFNNKKPAIDFNIDFKTVGEAYCRKIYGDKYEKLISNIKKFSPHLSKWLVIEGYGKVLSRRGLSLKKRELSIIAALTCLQYEEQLFSHINGAYRLGNDIQIIETVITNLNMLDQKHLTKFGLNVLKRFKKQKDII